MFSPPRASFLQLFIIRSIACLHRCSFDWWLQSKSNLQRSENWQSITEHCWLPMRSVSTIDWLKSTSIRCTCFVGIDFIALSCSCFEFFRNTDYFLLSLLVGAACEWPVHTRFGTSDFRARQTREGERLAARHQSRYQSAHTLALIKARMWFCKALWKIVIWVIDKSLDLIIPRGRYLTIFFKVCLIRFTIILTITNSFLIK